MAVTVIEAGPCVVVQKKGEQGQGAVYQLGFMPAKPKAVNKPIQGHFAKKGIAPHGPSEGISGLGRPVL